MKRKLSMGVAASMLAITTLASPSTAAAREISPIEDAVAAGDRTEDDKKLDASRQPAKVLDFMGLKPGDKAIEFLAGGGYYAKIMADAVGPEGSVVAVNPPAFLQREARLKHWAALVGQPSNIALQLKNFAEFKGKEASFDFAMMHLVYHDVYFESERFGITRAEPDMFLAELYKAMKPGGTVAVIDHHGPKGNTREISDKLHRIDRSTVVADFEKAGFTIAAESKLFVNDSDDQSKNVFTPGTRGKTSRFMIKFVKPE